MKTITKAFCASVLAFSLGGCILLESSPTFMPPGGPPCEALPGTSEPVYLCEDNVTQGILFVREDGDDEAEGSRERPVKTLERAFELAREQSDKKAILVAGSPTLTGPYTWPRAIDVLGGFDADFQQDETVRPTFSSQNAPVLSLNGLMQPVRLAHVDVQLTSNTSLPPQPVLLVESSTLVQLHSVSITAPDGVAGIDGMSGVPGQDGEKGLSGGQGTRIAPGMPGTNTSCPDAQGGAGGRGGDSAMQETPGESSVLGASGGAIEEPGASGMPGMPGQAGQEATLWSWSMEAMEATAGEAGLPGQGGGGGGGGDDLGVQGGGGGGGGAGGCGGSGGTPGTSGGWSLGVVLVHSALELSGTTRIETGDAGRAGQGGEGGQGGTGALGGTGAIGSGGGEAGGRGGDGAPGGQGGRGGHGQPGQSIGILCVESSVTQGEEVVLLAGRHGASIDGMMAQEGEPLSGCP